MTETLTIETDVDATQVETIENDVFAAETDVEANGYDLSKDLLLLPIQLNDVKSGDKVCKTTYGFAIWGANDTNSFAEVDVDLGSNENNYHTKLTGADNVVAFLFNYSETHEVLRFIRDNKCSLWVQDDDIIEMTWETLEPFFDGITIPEPEDNE